MVKHSELVIQESENQLTIRASAFRIVKTFTYLLLFIPLFLSSIFLKSPEVAMTFSSFLFWPMLLLYAYVMNLNWKFSAPLLAVGIGLNCLFFLCDHTYSS